MSFAPGDTIGPYTVLGKLGEGGMGEVYRARDTKLDRDVALKTLPDAFANDAERLARFAREAKTLASLNHPHIAQVYAVEDGRTEVRPYIAMELVEGEDLSERIKRGPIPLDEAIPFARQIAEALEAAHDAGIIHRDLKPANIKVRPDGTVKVLDFGLAKALDPPAGSSPNVSMSPTISLHATQAGMILGTAAYMSPEQARGKTVDRRADIWAFGAVLYEMLTGARAFGGEDLTVTLARVVEREPDFDALPSSVPPRVAQALRVCLRKDPRQRVGDIRDVRLALEGAFETATPQTTPLAAAAPRSAVARALPWTVAGVFGVVIVAGLVLWAPWRSAPVPAPRTLLASIGADASLPTGNGASAILSPDGTTLAFVAQQAGQRGLFIRTLDQLQAAPLAGTEGAENPFFSPDGQKLAVEISDGKNREIWVYEWARDTLTQLTFDPSDDTNPVWTPDGRRIVFGSDRAKAGTYNL